MSTYSEVVTISPEIMHGTPVFRGTRVPIQTAINYFKGGETIDDFLEGFPSVTREQVLQLLDIFVINLAVVAA